MSAKWQETAQDDGFGWKDLTPAGKVAVLLVALLALLAGLFLPWDRAPWAAKCPPGQVHVVDGSVVGCFTPEDARNRGDR